MNRFIAFLGLIFICASGYSQNEAAIWYFGKNAGLDFNGGAPMALTDGAMSTLEGCSAISDFNGNLRFYTDGITVWDRTHNPMPNGNGLLGHPSATQSGIIVPHPGNPNLFYVFTVDHIGEPNGLQYSIVDISLNGGLGDVTTKNVMLETPVTEKLTAVAHANGSDIWVLAHRVGSNDFIAYLVSATGLNTVPVVSSVGFSPTAWDHTGGYLKLSPDGTLLAACTPLDPDVQLFNFNTATGQVSNPIELEPFYTALAGTAVLTTYGLEFSSDSSKLYVTSTEYLSFTNLISRLHQFDLSSYNAADIIASATLLTSSSIQMGGAQLAIDGKIYITRMEQSFLGVINDPNVLGSGANYVPNGVSLAGRLSQFGLPPFITSYFIVGLHANNFCLGDATEFSVTTSEPVLTIDWDFGDGNTSILESPTHTYATSGTYTVSVTVTTASETKTESKDITIYNTPVANITTDFEACSILPTHQFDLSTKDAEVLGAQLPSENTVIYHPTLTDAQNGTNPLPNLYTNTNATETIFARISNANNPSCFDTTSFDLFVKEAPVLHPVTDWIVCDTDNDGFYDFDLTQKDGEILNGQSATTFSVSYHTTQIDADNNTNSIGPTYTNTTSPQPIFFRIQNSAHPECFETGTFNLEVILAVTANTPTDIEVCDDDNDGLFAFDLSTKDSEILVAQSPTDFNVSYHNSQSDADNGINAVNKFGYTNSTPYVETLYARVENNSASNCYNTVSFSLRIYDSPIQQTVTGWQVCDDDNDGIESFDLTQKDTEILGSQSAAQFSISYHLTQGDADTNSNPISGPYQNTGNPQTFYYRIENIGNVDCYLTDSFELQVFDTPVANLPTPFIVCDMNETGIQTFDLAQKDVEVLNGQNTATFEVLYFASQADAEANVSPLQKNVYSNTQIQETIYARIQNIGMDSCYDVTSFELRVSPLPQPDLEETYVICPDSPELIIDGGNFESWSWRDENAIEMGTGQTIDITELGDYSLTVTQTANGITCEKTVAFEVISSGAPEDFTVEIGEPSNQVELLVEVTGNGEFEYSVDNGNYQDSNRLEVFPGVHTVYVRDKFLCRTISKEILALGYQKFFTPNGDGYHERWNIIGADHYPESRLFIYDRYGKLLSQESPLGQGWDGTMNGIPLPSSDYWFRYIYDNGKVFSGHFTLKR